jgi:hypothetical protein
MGLAGVLNREPEVKVKVPRSYVEMPAMAA